MDNKSKLGAVGEKIVAELYGFQLSTDKYDSEKDMIDIISNETIEVKTQNRFKMRNEFTVNIKNGTNYHQVNKCCKVNRLFFVEYDDSNQIKVFECIDRNYKEFIRSNGQKVAGFNISNMILKHTLKNSTLAEHMRSLSQAKDYI